jgi:hypothetical protein
VPNLAQVFLLTMQPSSADSTGLFLKSVAFFRECSSYMFPSVRGRINFYYQHTFEHIVVRFHEHVCGSLRKHVWIPKHLRR